ncbi:MAG: hypothetical protein HYR56_17040 [Acidobacteria bacterium]|nr:hypothetical protein [Acidobacteriota bacterium]MBI3421593.1 hypothetical protein [Acidobacteriota bacterium]
MEARAAVSYKEDLLVRLRDPEYAAGYLNAVLEENDEAAFQLALRDVAEAKRMPLPAAQLQWTDVTGLLNALGIRLRLDWKRAA